MAEVEVVNGIGRDIIGYDFRDLVLITSQKDAS
jgi:hypothetical protein